MKLFPSEIEPVAQTDNPLDSRAETESLNSAFSLRSYYASSDDGLPAYTDEPSTPLTPGTSNYSETPQNRSSYGGSNAPMTRNANVNNVPHPVWSSSSRATGPRPPSGTVDTTFTCDPERLRNLLLEQARIAPRPFVLFEGEHNEKRDDNGKTETRAVTDFRVLVDCSEIFQPQTNVSNYDVPPWYELHTVPDHVKAHRGGVFATRAKATGFAFHDLEGMGSVYNPTTTYDAQGLRGWCHIYCSKADRSMFPYTLTLRRRISEWDTTFLEIGLTRMIRQTNYRGRVRVTFPLEDSTFTVYSPHWMNRARTNKYIWWTCVLLFLWIITWPILWICTGRFEVLHSVWPYKKPNPRNPTQALYASYSEQQWLDTWGHAVIDAAFGRRQQTLTVNDLERVVLAQQASSTASSQYRVQAQSESRVGDTGSNIFHGLFNMRNEQDLARGWGADDDAGWWTTTRYQISKKVMLK